MHSSPEQPLAPSLRRPDRMGAVLSADAEALPFSELGPNGDERASQRLEGFRAGREEGFAVGHAEGLEIAKRSIAAAIDGLHNAVLQIENAGTVIEDRVASVSVALATELAEAIVGGDLSLLETGEDVVIRALALRRSSENVRIRLHPDHPALENPPERVGLELVADPELGPTDAFAEIGEGLSNLSIDAAITRIREVLA